MSVVNILKNAIEEIEAQEREINKKKKKKKQSEAIKFDPGNLVNAVGQLNALDLGLVIKPCEYRGEDGELTIKEPDKKKESLNTRFYNTDLGKVIFNVQNVSEIFAVIAGLKYQNDLNKDLQKKIDELKESIATWRERFADKERDCHDLAKTVSDLKESCRSLDAFNESLAEQKDEKKQELIKLRAKLKRRDKELKEFALRCNELNGQNLIKLINNKLITIQRREQKEK